MAHPVVAAIEEEIPQLDHAATELSIKVASGERSEEIKERLREILQRAKRLHDQLVELTKKSYEGIQTWMPSVLDEVISTCQVCLRYFDPLRVLTEPAP